MKEREVIRILKRDYPAIVAEINKKISDRKPVLMDINLIDGIVEKVKSNLKYKAKSKTILVAVILHLYAPESLHQHVKLRTKGLRDALSDCLEISVTSISKEIGKARVFYKTYPDFRAKMNTILNQLNVS